MGTAGPSAGRPHLSRVDARAEAVRRERPRLEVRLAPTAEVERERVPAGEQVAGRVERGGAEIQLGGELGLAGLLAVDQRAQPRAPAGPAREVARDEQPDDPAERQGLVGAARPDRAV